MTLNTTFFTNVRSICYLSITDASSCSITRLPLPMSRHRLQLGNVACREFLIQNFSELQQLLFFKNKLDFYLFERHIFFHGAVFSTSGKITNLNTTKHVGNDRGDTIQVSGNTHKKRSISIADILLSERYFNKSSNVKLKHQRRL